MGNPIQQIINYYFQGTGEFINTKFFCRVCTMLHDPKPQIEHFTYEDVNEWWRGKGTCINGSWRKFQRALEADAKKAAAAALRNNNKSENKLAENKADVAPAEEKVVDESENAPKPASLP
jgi:hypothetical protein